MTLFQLINEKATCITK